MKKTIWALLSVLMVATMLIGATVFASAEATDVIVPEVPSINTTRISLGRSK